MRTNEKEFTMCFQGKAVFKMSVYIWFTEDWNMVSDCIDLKSLVYYDLSFKLCSVSMFSLWGGVLQSVSAEMIIWVYFPPESGVYVLKAYAEMTFYKKFPLWRGGIGISKKSNFSREP